MLLWQPGQKYSLPKLRVSLIWKGQSQSVSQSMHEWAPGLMLPSHCSLKLLLAAGRRSRACSRFLLYLSRRRIHSEWRVTEQGNGVTASCQHQLQLPNLQSTHGETQPVSVGSVCCWVYKNVLILMSWQIKTQLYWIYCIRWVRRQRGGWYTAKVVDLKPAWTMCCSVVIQSEPAGRRFLNSLPDPTRDLVSSVKCMETQPSVEHADELHTDISTHCNSESFCLYGGERGGGDRQTERAKRGTERRGEAGGRQRKAERQSEWRTQRERVNQRLQVGGAPCVCLTVSQGYISGH